MVRHFKLLLPPTRSLLHSSFLQLSDSAYLETRSDMEAPQKRRRVERSPSPVLKIDDNDDFQYIPAAQRRQAKLAKLTSRGNPSDKNKALRQQQEQEEREDEEREEERRREKARKERTLLMEAQEVHDRRAAEGMSNLYTNTITLPNELLHYRCKENRG